LIEEPVGAALDRILAPATEKAEREIDAFIERRHAKRVLLEGERDEEEAWKASERRRDAAREAALKQE